MTQSDSISFQDRLLFARPFQYETTFTMDDAVKRLRTLDQTPSALFQQFNSSADVSLRYGKVTFDIRFNRGNRFANYCMAQATGEITEDANGKQIVSGIVRFGLTYFLFAIIAPILLLGVIILSPRSFVCGFPVIIALAASMWFTLISGYRKLNQTMPEILL